MVKNHFLGDLFNVSIKRQILVKVSEAKLMALKRNSMAVISILWPNTTASELFFLKSQCIYVK